MISAVQVYIQHVSLITGVRVLLYALNIHVRSPCLIVIARRYLILVISSCTLAHSLSVVFSYTTTSSVRHLSVAFFRLAAIPSCSNSISVQRSMLVIPSHLQLNSTRRIMDPKLVPLNARSQSMLLKRNQHKNKQKKTTITTSSTLSRRARKGRLLKDNILGVSKFFTRRSAMV